MKTIVSEEEFNKDIQNHDIVLVLYGSKTCMPCVSLKQKLIQWQAEHPNCQCLYVPIEEAPLLCASNQVFSAPTIRVYVMQKLSIKASGAFSFEAIVQQVNRYQTLLK